MTLQESVRRKTLKFIAARLISSAFFGYDKEIDSLGRIVIPKDYRDRLQLGSRVEIILTTDGILIQNPEYELIKNSRRKEK